MDAHVFRAVVEYHRETWSDDVVLKLDPRPIWIPEVGRLPGPADYHGGRDDVVAARLVVLAAMEVDTASGVPRIPGCHPLLSAPPGQRVVHGCPEESTTIVLLDTVRVGTEPGTWVLRELPIHYSPRVGASGQVTDNVVGRDGGAWVVLDRRRLGFYER